MKRFELKSLFGILAVTLYISFSSGAIAQPGNVAIEPDAQFEEVAGEREFSGRVIARPVQVDTLKKMGWEPLQIDAAVHLIQVELGKYHIHWHEPLVDHYVIRVPDGSNENQFIRHLMAMELFEFAEPDWILYPVECPNDTFFSLQWHHGPNRMRSCDGWNFQTGGPSVGIGICDTGIQTNHPDLLLHRRLGYNAVDQLWEHQGGNIGPVHPHGTNVTGCAAANGNNALGVSGVGWNLSHRMLRVSNVASGSASLSVLNHAALTSIQSGDKVANVSYSGVNSSSVRSTATQIKNLGGLLVWAAGNSGANINWGNRDNDDVIVVGATNSADVLESYSNRGLSMDLVAPGTDIATTGTGSNYVYATGTSFAAPLTAGLIGLIWSLDPSLTPNEVENILKSGCDDLGASGVDNNYGYGRINVFNSLSLVGTPNTPPEIIVNSPTANSTVTFGSSVSFNSTTIDAEDGDISSLVSWNSSLDGLLGTGNFSTSTLSAGVHSIQASVTDSGGGMDSVSFDLTVEMDSIPATPSVSSSNEGLPGVITITWIDNSNNETGFDIFRQQRIGGSWTNGTLIGTTGPDITAFVDNVSAGAPGWRYRVRAKGAAGNSAYSSYKATRPARPTNLSASLNGSLVQVSWSDVSDIESGFQVQRQQRIGGSWTNTTTLPTFAMDTQVILNEPGAGTWRYRVRSNASGASSAYTSWSSGVNAP